MLTRRQLYALYDEGPAAVVALVEDLYDYIAATEPPEVRSLRLTVDAQLAVILKLQVRLKRLGERLARQECLNYALKRRLSELGSLVGTDSHNSRLPPPSGPPSVRRTRSRRRRTGKKTGVELGHRGSTRTPQPCPDHVYTHAPAECRACGASLDAAPATSESPPFCRHRDKPTFGPHAASFACAR